MLLPDYEVLEREERLLVGTSPVVGERNAVAVALAVLLGGPAIVAAAWVAADVPAAGVLAAGAATVAPGVWLLRRAARADYSIREANALVVDRAADRVTWRGRELCAATDVAAEVRYHEDAPDELALVIRSPLSAGQDSVPTLTGPASFLDEPARRVAAHLGVVVRRR